MKPRIQYAKTEDGVSIAFWTLGEGRPFVHMPLVPFGHTQLECQIARISEWYNSLAQDRLLVTYDRRGTGMSDRTVQDYSLDAQVLDLEAVVGHLRLDEPFTLFGGGNLGPVAIAYATRHREKLGHMLLWATSARIKGSREQANLLLRDLIDTDWQRYSETVAGWEMGWEDPVRTKDYVALFREGSTPESFVAYSRVLNRGFDVQALLQEVQTPTLILQRRGGPTGLGKAKELASSIPDARLMLLEEEGYAPWDSRETVMQAIDEFLGDAPAATGDEMPAQGGAAAADMTRVAAPEPRTFASGRYVVKRLLGQGAQKSVYLVDDTVLGRQCAVSMLNPALLDQSDVDRIKREAQTMAQLGTQPNIVTVHDYGEEDGAPFIVCEYVPGGELRDELAAAAGPLPLERALTVATDICRALSFAHGRNIVHRDLKPENVWLTEERSAKLGDFGIALSIGRTRLTMPGGVTGTATYMAPEQASGGEVDARSDLYAFGVLLYELVTGRPPFVGDDPNAVIYQHVNTEPESPVEHNASLPPSLERLILKLLAKTKAERPSSADEVLAELEQAATELAGGLSTATVRHAPASSPIEQEIRFCTSADGTRIAYATYGDPAARALVHVQNLQDVQEFCWKSVVFRTMYEQLASGRRLVTFDRRGVGGSQRDVDDLAIPAQVADLAAVVDKLGLESFDLMCWFGGGPLAAAYAAEHPEHVRRLVLWHTAINTSGQPYQGAQDMAESIRGNWAFARRSWAAMVYPKGPTELQRWFSNMMRDSVAPEVAARHFEVDAEFDGSTILPSIQAPTLVLANHQGVGTSQSEIASIRTVASLIPDSRLVTLEGATATAVVGNSFLAALRNFLDEGRAQ